MQNSERQSNHKSESAGVIKGKNKGLFIELLVIIFFMSSLFLNSCTTGDPVFFDRVLSDFDSNSYYIALNIKSPFYNGRALIENDDLYNFLHKKEGIDKASYHKKMKRILLHNRYLKVDERDIKKWKFIKVKLVDTVIFEANKGVNSFIAKYFDGVLMNPGLSYDEIYAVIDQMFYWGIPLRVDPVSNQILLDD
jgi:hypothetical protein